MITMKPPIIVRDLAEHLKKKPFELIAALMKEGVFATVNQAIEGVQPTQLLTKDNVGTITTWSARVTRSLPRNASRRRCS